MTIAIITVLISILLPTLGSAREAGRQGVCLSNLRQAYIACQTYADAHDGQGPAIGQPYIALPFWALVVQEASGASFDHERVNGDGEALHVDLYSTSSVLVCPTVDAAYAEDMTRTFAMNATGHAGAGDPDDYDQEGTTAHINFALVTRTSDTPLLMDSAVSYFPDGAPPPTRTSSVIDFRQASHVEKRLGRFHWGDRAYDAAMFDGSARSHVEVPSHWLDSLP